MSGISVGVRVGGAVVTVGVGEGAKHVPSVPGVPPSFEVHKSPSQQSASPRQEEPAILQFGLTEVGTALGVKVAAGLVGIAVAIGGICQAVQFPPAQTRHIKTYEPYCPAGKV